MIVLSLSSKFANELDLVRISIEKGFLYWSVMGGRSSFVYEYKINNNKSL